MLSHRERRKLLVDWNATSVAREENATLVELFEASADRFAQATAVVAGEDTLSYHELDARANQLGHFLKRTGVGPDVPVALCVERSLEMIVGILGVLKAGGAYVPIDPQSPSERIASVLADTQARVVLTRDSLAGRLPATAAKLVTLDLQWKTIACEPPTKPEVRIGPKHLAYVIYTSGSSGQPKGVMITHEAILNNLQWMQRVYPLTPADAVLQQSSISFDASVSEIFTALMAGARLVLAQPGGEREPAYLASLIQNESITTVQVVPSLLHLLLEERALSDCRSLRRVFSGGEILTAKIVQQFYALLPNATLHNVYGPTEATIDATAWDCAPALESQSIPIGRPIDNVRCYIVDRDDNLVPVGMAGELWIGGRGVARGYWQRPDLTAQKFLPDPFVHEPGACVYRTGDFCRYREDGAIEFIGRADDQVKLRGFRIELGEIEVALKSHPKVKDAVVVLRQDSIGNSHLFSYFIVKRNRLLTEAKLRQWLKHRLPEYMIPTGWMAMDDFPLMPSGKIDRRALPAPPENGPISRVGYVPPRDELETELAKLWARILGISQVGAHDNWFFLGGDSLGAVRLFAELEKLTGERLLLTTLIEAPTVAEIAAVLRQGGSQREFSCLVPIRPTGSRPPLFVVHHHSGHVLFCRDLAKHLDPAQPVYGLQAEPAWASRESAPTVEQAATTYLRAIRSMQPVGPYYLGGYCAGGGFAYEMAQQLHRAGEQVAFLGLFESWMPGHPMYPAALKPWQRTLFDILNEVRLHWGSLALLSTRAKLTYFHRRGTNLATQIMHRLGWMQPSGEELPLIEQSIARAVDRYVAQPYSGRVVLFRSYQHRLGTGPKSYLGWDRVTISDLVVEELPVSPGAIALEPRARFLAHRLQRYLGSSDFVHMT